jgi:translation elongation factor EF-1beta
MKGFELLQSLSNEIKKQICQEYKSIECFYQYVFDLNVQHFNLFMKKPEGYTEQIDKIKNELYDIDEKLESFGITEGDYITNEIGGDCNEIIAGKYIVTLENDLRKNFGTSYETMRVWLRENSGI